MQLEDLGLQGGSRKTLVILGAGASRGASFVKDKTAVLPPLDLDFFQQLSRLQSSPDADALISFVREEYGHELRLSMEQFFSEADYTNRFHKELNVDRGRRVRKYEHALAAFHRAVPQLLRTAANSACEYHGTIAANLQTGDSIISFNYDCVIDAALRNHGGNRWDPARKGYGFEIGGFVEAWRKPTRGKRPRSSIELLKMHGSMNWLRDDGRTKLLANLDDVETTAGSIVAPTWFKDFTEEPFASVWKRARLAVRSARILVAIGYSVPQTDLFSQSLLKVEAGSKLKRERLDALVLVNPDREARCKILDLVRGGLEASTRVLEYDTLATLNRRLTKNRVATAAGAGA